MSSRPELPNPAMSVNPNGSLSCISGEWFSKEQILAYGEACAKAEAEALRKDAERLEFVLYAGAFLVFKDADSGAKTCQLWVQDEDENHHAISGRRWFACPRAAIDAAIAAQQGEEP